MPELPEAETNRRRVEAGALNRTIVGFEDHNSKHLELPGPEDRERLTGHRFTETRRHGKTIFVGSASGPWLAVHLGMTGTLRTFDRETEMTDGGRIVVVFEGDRRLLFSCPRKFGWMRRVEDPDAAIAEAGLGPDALAIDADAFVATFSTRQKVKPALLDQKKMAGLGNLWSDEVLFQAGIAPDRRCRDLGEDALRDLHRIMQAALEKGCATSSDYARLPGDWLLPVRAEGADCPRCGGTIVMREIGGRAAHYCPDHQS